MTVMPREFEGYASPRPKDIIWARWRENIIKPALACARGTHLRKLAVDEIARQARVFPDGRIGKISTVTAYKWIKSYETVGFKGLIRKGRSDRCEFRVMANREWDKFFAPRIDSTVAERIQEDLDDAIGDFWEGIGASWRLVSRNSTEWLLHRTRSIRDVGFEALPLGYAGDGAGSASQYGLCWVNRRRVERDR